MATATSSPTPPGAAVPADLCAGRAPGPPPPAPSSGAAHYQQHLRNNSNGINTSTTSDLSEDEDFSEAASLPEMQGTVSKWTNYIHGWQNRFFSLKEGTLVYYKSANETDFGCRGAISIQKATIKSHELDELRFDVSVNDCVWYLRAPTLEDRQTWVDTLETHKQMSVLDHQQQQQQQQQHLHRHGSVHSLTSNTMSMKSCGKGGGGGGGGAGRGLAEKLAEIETFRDILCRQVDTLQGYFDVLTDVSASAETSGAEDATDGSQQKPPSNPRELLNGLQSVDFKGEAITFKATTAGILATLSHCIELLNQREEYWRRRCDRESLGRRLAEEKYRNAIEFATPASVEHPQPKEMLVKTSPDYEEGPHSQLGEDEFFDAVENALDKLEEEQEYCDRLRQVSVEDAKAELDGDGVESATKEHDLWPSVDKITREQLHYARLLPGGADSVWELFAEDGEMKMYKREEEVDGMVVDPLKALHQVRGVTARELTHFFFCPEYRMEWETTLEHASVLEKVSNDTILFLQLHKRIWPAAQRDSCFFSHLRKVAKAGGGGNGGADADLQVPDGAHDTYLVCNKSIDHPDAPMNVNGIQRVDLVVIFVCDTIVDEKRRHLPDDKLTRGDISCKITYCSVVNPGGWAPASVLRTVYKREYPRFLKRFTQYVIDKTKAKPIMW